ncbi:MAG: hypothetical protein ABI597_01285 [Gammaproteobacteria bacterium]
MFSKPKQHPGGYLAVSDGTEKKPVDFTSIPATPSSFDKEQKKIPTPVETALDNLRASSQKSSEIELETAVTRKIVLAIQKGATLAQIEAAMKYSVRDAGSLIKTVVDSTRQDPMVVAFRAAYQKEHPAKPQAQSTLNILNL